MPGLKSREIARRLGIDDRRELNRFLHYEGKAYRGLFVRNWRWYHSGVDQPDLHPSAATNPGTSIVDNFGVGSAAFDPSGSQSMASRTLCGVLRTMNELDAIRQIRRLDQLAIEKAFSEDEYTSLADLLKIELIQRLEELRKSPTYESTSQVSPAKGLIFFVLIVLAIAVLVAILD
jgi:hypothetical protein